jgi:N-acetylmuramoyl-L-alanine amidase
MNPDICGRLEPSGWHHCIRRAAIYVLGALIGTAVAASTAGACEPADFPVAIDVGHDRDHPGAISARGVPEFEFNLALGREVMAALHASVRIPVNVIGHSGRR